MDILETIKRLAQEEPHRAAYELPGESLTYGELEAYSDRLAAYLSQRLTDQEPLMVYGHKSPLMPIAFLACAKSGRAYCPVDTSVPSQRVQMILRMLPSELVLAVEEMDAEVAADSQKELLTAARLTAIIRNEAYRYDGRERVSGDDIFYIIFTSGSTGVPKGVQITCRNLNSFLAWSVTLGGRKEEKRGRVFLNQAPFSFDLSVMDLYTCLACGGVLKPLTAAMQQDYQRLFERLGQSAVHIWVSTPSFVEICLADPVFCQQNLPELTLFLFCGETLPNKIVEKIYQRFPNAKVINTYGPTETTVAVTQIEITQALLAQENPLPVGYVKADSALRIVNEAGQPVPDGEKGEIVILGESVSAGYYHNPQQTERVFFADAERPGRRGYHSGDEGYVTAGRLYCCGRKDRQVKLHGFRIEIDDIENNLLRLKQIEAAVVLPRSRHGEVKSLVAFVQEKDPQIADEKQEALACQQELRSYLPHYMIPKKMYFIDHMPMTSNGKVDRKHLEGMLR